MKLGEAARYLCGWSRELEWLDMCLRVYKMTRKEEDWLHATPSKKYEKYEGVVSDTAHTNVHFSEHTLSSV